MMAIFHLDFCNGMCRYSRGDSLDAAIADAYEASLALNLNVNVLDSNLRRVATLEHRHDNRINPIYVSRS